MLRLRFILGGVFSVVSTRIYKSWDKCDPKTMDEIVKLSMNFD